MAIIEGQHVSTTDRARVNRASLILAEVQALRTVAVMLVVIYHVWPDPIPGGFIGVDVFFVISGFLITSHLVREVQRTGTISVTEFWARRIRRLLPASMLVLAICAVLLWTVYPAVFRWPGMEEIAYASAYMLNWLLAANAVDYLRAGDSATLVQHFWSLSVEEQFYVVWPLLLMLALFASSRLWVRQNAARPETVVLVTAALVVIASFVYSVFMSHYKPAFAYFDTGTRAWELGLGAIFAALLLRWPDQIARLRAMPVFARGGLGLVAGFALIIASAFLIGPDQEFPGWLAISPTFGALLVIAAGMPRNSWLGPFVGWRPVQYVGDVSYELYLVHWPLVVTFGVIVGHDPNSWDGLLLIALAVVLATVLRSAVAFLLKVWKAMRAQRRVAFAFAATGAILFGAAAVVTLQWQQDRVALATEVRDRLVSVVENEHPASEDPLACYGAATLLSGADCPSRFEMTDTVDLTAAASDLDRENWCLTWYNQDWLQCERGDLSGTHGTIALVGDSHAAAWTGAMDTYFGREGWKVVTYTRFGCTGLEQPNPALGGNTDAGQMWDACVTWGKRVRTEIASRTDIDAVVLTNWQLSAATPPGPDLPPHLTSSTIAASLQQVADTGKPLVYIEDAPNTSGTPVPECLAATKQTFAPCSTLRSERYLPSLMQQGIAESGLEVGYVSTVDAYCDSQTCYSVIGGVVVYPDDNHTSETWVRSLMPYVGPEILAHIVARPGS